MPRWLQELFAPSSAGIDLELAGAKKLFDETL
jgi:hypothetical protein